MAIIELQDTTIDRVLENMRKHRYYPNAPTRSIKAKLQGIVLLLVHDNLYPIWPVGSEIGSNYRITSSPAWEGIDWYGPDAPWHYQNGYYENRAARQCTAALDREWLDAYGRDRFAAELPDHLELRDLQSTATGPITVIWWKQAWLEDLFVARLIHEQLTEAHYHYNDHQRNLWLGTCTHTRHGVLPPAAPRFVLDVNDQDDMLLPCPRYDLSEHIRPENITVRDTKIVRTLDDPTVLLSNIPKTLFRSLPQHPLVGDLVRAFCHQPTTFSQNVIGSDAWRRTRLRTVNTLIKKSTSKEVARPHRRASTGRRVEIAEVGPAAYGFGRDDNGWIEFALDSRLENYNYVDYDPAPLDGSTRNRILEGKCNSMHVHYSEADGLWRILVTLALHIPVNNLVHGVMGLTYATCIGDRECARKPLFFVPPRGMPKHISTALRNTPYMVSAISHALGEAQVVFGPDKSGKPLLDQIIDYDKPKLPKSVVAHQFVGNHCSLCGPTRVRSSAHGLTLDRLLQVMAPVSRNTLPEKVVQPVALPTSTRRVEADLDDIPSSVVMGNSRRLLEL